MRKVDKTAFGQRVQARITKLGTSQSAIAKALSVPQQTVQNVCAGKVERPRFIDELAEALLTTKEWLLYEKGPEQLAPQTLRQRSVEMLETIDDEKLGLIIQYLESLRSGRKQVA